MTRWRFAEKYHWTLEYIDSLKQEDTREILAIEEGIAKAKL